MHCLKNFGLLPVAIVLLLGSALPARAQDGVDARETRMVFRSGPISGAAQLPAPQGARRDRVLEGSNSRPGAMLPLYTAYASLQVMDLHSTSRALGSGRVEANPVMRGAGSIRAGQLAVKAAGTAAVFYAGEKLWKKNKAGAVIFMIAANSAMAVVVQHNYRAAR